MADAVIGALRVILGADTALLEKDLRNAAAKLGAFAGIASGISQEITRGLTNAITNFAQAIPKAISSMEGLNKASQKLGISVEELSGLKYAAELADVSFEQLSKGVVKFSQAMTKSVVEPSGEAARAFKALGVEAKDSITGRVRPTADVLIDVADKFSKLSDDAAKTTVATKLFGKTGAELIPFLNQGRDGIQALTKEAEKFGLIVSSEAARSAEEFNDNLKRLEAINQGIINQFTTGMLPGLEDMAKALLIAKENGSGFTDWGELAGSIMGKLGNTLATVQLIIKRLAAEWVAFNELMNAFTFEALGKAWEKWNKVDAESVRLMGELNKKLNDATVPIGQTSTGIVKITDDTKGLNTELLKSTEALDKFIAGQEKNVKMLQLQISTFGMLPAAAAAAKIQIEAAAKAQEANISITSAQQKKLDEIKAATAGYTDELTRLQMVQQNMTPAEQFAKEMEKINILYAGGAKLSDEFAIQVERTAERFGMAWNQVAEKALGGFTQLTSEFGKQSETWFNISKGLAIVEATINTYTAFTKALTAAVYPLNLVLAAGTLAAGMAKVIAIKSQTFKAATGASFRVPGGMGGGDKKYMPMMLEPGEQVDVWRPDQLGGDPRGRAGGGNVTIRVDGAWRPFVEQLIPQLNSAMGDGYKLKLAPA